MRRAIMTALLLLLGGGGFYWWWNQPEKIIARRTVALIEAVEVPASSGNIHRATRGDALSGFLAPNVALLSRESAAEDYTGPQSRSSLVSLYTALAKYCRHITVGSIQVVEITIDGDEARVSAQVDAAVELPDGTMPADGIQHLDLVWKKTDDKWLLSSVEWSESER